MNKVYINDVEYAIDDGIIIQDKYTEELDTSMITISFVDKLNLSPFDRVIIEDDRFGIKYFLVDTWTDDIVSFEPLKYTYNISLISETIKLQKVVLPNVTITQPIEGTKKTIIDMLERYCLTYVYKQYPELELGDKIYKLKIECPEYEFNRPTAYEVFNTLLSVVNGVVTINNGIIDYIELDKYGNEIDTSNLYYENETQNIKEYANRLDVQVTNAVSKQDNFSTLSGVGMRAEGQATLNTDNMTIVLDKPIYDFGMWGSIVAFVPYVRTYQDAEGNELTDYGSASLDITPHVVEKSIYDTYLVSTNSDLITEKNYKRNALYYVRGDNKIEGLNYNEDNLVGNSTIIALQNIIEVEFNKAYNSQYSLAFSKSEIMDNVFFEATYKTQDNYRFIVEKDNKYNATLIDNQTETQVDASNFGKVEQDKLNRLGNKNKIISATYKKKETIPELGDYIEDYVLAEREIVYYDDYALFKGYLYKDFIRKNLFYGLASKKRSTQYSQESVVRNDAFKYNVSFELERDSITNLGRYIITPLSFSGYEAGLSDTIEYINFSEFPKYCVISTRGSRTGPSLIDKGNEEKLILTPSYFACGKSNIINFKFMDNISAGIRLTDSVIGGKKQEYVSYVDENGEFQVIEYAIYTNDRKEFFDAYLDQNNFNNRKKISNNLPLITKTNLSNLISFDNLIISGVKSLYKDNRETISISINIDYKDSEHVIIGNAFSEYTGIYNAHNVALGLCLCYSTNEEYEIGDTRGLGTIDSQINVRINPETAFDFIAYGGAAFDNLTLENLGGVDMSNWKSWGIVEKDTNRLILGVNKGNLKEIPKSIYIKVEEKDY